MRAMRLIGGDRSRREGLLRRCNKVAVLPERAHLVVVVEQRALERMLCERAVRRLMMVMMLLQ